MHVVSCNKTTLMSNILSLFATYLIVSLLDLADLFNMDVTDEESNPCTTTK